ncbi:MAG: alginate export family protein [Asticcacaulis sp.]
MRIFTHFLRVSLAALASAAAFSAHADENLSAALAASKPIIDSSLRYEGVDQQDFRHHANALTWRNRLGLQTGDFHHFKALVEFENVTALTGDYNSTTNGKALYPTVPDPEVTELNRAQIMWTPTAATSLTVGRQRIILDDARFIGNVGWRQDEQTFDGVRLDVGFGKLKVTGAYLSKINRVLAETRDWDSDSLILNASYDINKALKLTVFDYALDFRNAAASSTQTVGVRATGAGEIGALKLAYVAQYASQSDYRNNPANFTLEESMLEVAATYKIATFRVNYESLGGNGTVGFVTPLGTVHAFQGWSDVFSGTGGNKTLAAGIDDLSVSLSVALPTWSSAPVFKMPKAGLIYHDLKTGRDSADIGTELDAVATAGLTKNLSLLVKYASFDPAGPAFPAARTKTWIMLQYKL